LMALIFNGLFVVFVRFEIGLSVKLYHPWTCALFKTQASQDVLASTRKKEKKIMD
jgi:hypothetical protein